MIAISLLCAYITIKFIMQQNIQMRSSLRLYLLVIEALDLILFIYIDCVILASYMKNSSETSFIAADKS